MKKRILIIVLSILVIASIVTLVLLNINKTQEKENKQNNTTTNEKVVITPSYIDVKFDDDTKKMSLYINNKKIKFSNNKGYDVYPTIIDVPNKRVVFSAEDGNKYDLYIVNSNGKNLFNILDLIELDKTSYKGLFYYDNNSIYVLDISDDFCTNYQGKQYIVDITTDKYEIRDSEDIDKDEFEFRFPTYCDN